MNPNEMPRNDVSSEELDSMFARTNEEAAADYEARLQAAGWPKLIERMLGVLWRRSSDQEGALAAIDARLAALERTYGFRQG